MLGSTFKVRLCPNTHRRQVLRGTNIAVTVGEGEGKGCFPLGQLSVDLTQAMDNKHLSILASSIKPIRYSCTQ